MIASELRLGNKVEDSNGFILDVVSIDSDGTIYCDFKGNEGDVWEFDNKNPCFGIPLTEEILLKCGFKKLGSVFCISEICVVDTSENIISFYIDRIEEDIDLDLPKHLHSIQNLYFALTGKELTINL